MGPPDLEAVQVQYGLDERCMKGLADLTPSDQVIVLDIVANKQQCNNVSAFTWAVVRKMREAPAQLKLEYLTRHLDERCLDGLRKLPPPAQEMVASSVDPLRVKNLNGFTWKQIRAMQQQTGSVHGGVFVPMMGPMSMQMPGAYMRMGMGSMGGPYGGMMQMMPMQGHMGARDRSRTPGGAGLSAQIAHLRAGLAANGGGRSGGGKGGPMGHASDISVPAFLSRAGLDANAMQAFMALDPGSQKIVVALVTKQAARNPSAVTWSMIRQVKEKPEEAKMEYLRIAMDADAAAALEKLSPEEQESILSSVDVAHCRNLSAFIWSRAKVVEGGGANGRPGAEAEAEEEEALDPLQVAGVQLDARCQQKLQDLPVDQQMAILQSVPADCRNPSAFVWSKIKGKA